MNQFFEVFRSAGAQIKASDISVRTPLYHPDLPFVVLWSEKAACTVIVKWFLFHSGLLDEALAHGPWIHKYENEIFKAREGYNADCLTAIRSGLPVIKFVRNPYLRAYSGFLETCSKRVLDNAYHWSTDTRRQVLKSLLGTSGNLEYAYSFTQFATWMGSQRDGSLDVHLAPQFTTLEKRVTVECLQLEMEEGATHYIEQRFGLRSTRRRHRIYSSGHHHDKHPLPAAQARSVLSLGMPVRRSRDFHIFDVPVDVVASSEAGAVLRKVFRHDFEAYGYDLLLDKPDTSPA